MQADVAFKRRRKRQAAWDSEVRADALRTCAQASIVNWSERHARIGPQILEIVEWRRYPIVCKREVRFRFWIECGFIGDLRCAAKFEKDTLIDFRMIDRSAVKFGRRPWKYKHVVTLAGSCFGGGKGVEPFQGT